jgi:hypothetical protein
MGEKLNIDVLLSIPELILILIIALLTGRVLLQALHSQMEASIASALYSLALGMGFLGYVILALGLFGFLHPIPVISILLLLGFLSGFTLFSTRRKAHPHAKPSMHPVAEPPLAVSPSVYIAAIAVLILFGVIALINCMTPPGPHEWDALSYHLAAPQVWINQGKISFLPTDHHSNFPFLTEMLFLLGLLLNGFPLANLFHWTYALICVIALLTLGQRYFSKLAGILAALTLVLAPITIWESGAAYIEMSFAAYVLLALFALMEYERERKPGWLRVAGALMGFALGVKALALIPIFAILLILIFRRTNIRHLALLTAITTLFGFPFYLKSLIMTGNPVYPFAYRIFGGKYWSQTLANTYSTEQRSFGQSHQSVTVAMDAQNERISYQKPTFLDDIRNMFEAPFKLISIPRIYYNFNDPGERNHLGFLFLSFTPLIFLADRRSRSAMLLIGILAVWYVTWFFSMQYVRYLLPALPLIGLAGGEGVERILRKHPPLKYAILIAVLLQAGLTLSAFLPELLGSNRLPGRLDIAISPNARETYLERTVNVYPAEEWINNNTPKNAGVILFEETRGFFLKRPYLWGNGGHSLYIPYDAFRNGRDMTNWFLQRGYEYAIINLQFTQKSQSLEGMQMLEKAVRNHQEGDLLLKWYGTAPGSDERWRLLVGDALRRGAMALISDASSHGVAVLQFLPSDKGTGK